MPELMRHALHVFSPRGPMATRRMTAYWGVLAAAALTTLAVAAVAAAIAVFMGQALPLAVQHDLTAAPGTDMSVTALVNDGSQASSGGATLRSQVAAAIPGVPFSFRSASWSDPLGLVPGALPASPAGAASGNATLLQAASMSGITGHATLIAGRWPAAPAAATAEGGGPAAIPAALPASAAKLLHVSVGDVLRLRDRLNNGLLSFNITGVFAPRPPSGPDDSYWALSYIPASGVSASYATSTYGPLVVNQAAFGPALTQQSGSWLAQPDMASFQNGSLGPDSASVAALVASLPNATFLNGAQLTTNLPTVLEAAGSNLTVARSLLVISALQLLVLAVVALAAVGRLLAAQREDETALFIARGATRWQLIKLTAAEVVPLSALVSVVGALAGVWLADALVGAGALGTAGIRLAGRPGVWPDALAAAIVVALVAIGSLLAPALTAVARAHGGRQGLVAGVTRVGLDIALIVLAVLACWQLRQFSAVGASGSGGIDPVLALAPALALAAGSVVVLRLLPLAALVADWLAARGRGLLAALASWQFSRMPVRQGGAALLLVMAVAAGTLALAQHQSWTRSASDQANFTAGADVQVDLPAALSPGGTGAVADARGVTRSMAVAVDDTGTPGDLVAVDSAQAAGVVRLRGDEAVLPPASLFGAITPAGAGQPGAALPAPRPGAGAGRNPLTVTLGPAAATAAAGKATGSAGKQPAPGASGVAAALGPVGMTLTILDRTGAAFQVEDEGLAADGRPHVIAVPLGGDEALYPLRVVSISVTYSLALGRVPTLALTLRGLSLAGWTQQATMPAPMTFAPGQGADPSDGKTQISADAATFTFHSGDAPDFSVAAGGPGRDQMLAAQLLLVPHEPRVPSIPAIATRAFMNANSQQIGSVVPESVEGATVPLRIVAEVASFPTVTAPGGALITNLGSLQAYLARQSLPPLPVTQWWLTTAGGQVPPALTASVPAGTGITTAAGLTTANTGDPLSAAPQLALLAMAAAASLLAIMGFWVSIAADVRERRAGMALLAALGVTRRGAAVSLCLEKLLLSLPSAALGVVLGTLVARLLVPAVTLSPTARQPTPPALTLYDLPQAIALALVVAIVPVVIAALAATRRPDPAADLRAAEAA
jgi:ABC-type antimicrobial peptide transport system permease subunit